MHIFSHIHQTYCVQTVTVDESNVKLVDQSKCKWVTRQQFLEGAVSTAMKKVTVLDTKHFTINLFLMILELDADKNILGELPSIQGQKLLTNHFQISIKQDPFNDHPCYIIQ